MRTWTILLDMDGVLVNFAEGVWRLHRLPLEVLWPVGVSSVTDVFETTLGMGEKDFWDEVDAQPWEWWAKLPPTEGAERFYRRLTELAVVVLCTRPRPTSRCIYGKMQWARRLLGEDVELCFIKDKSLLGRPGNVLIDDHDSTAMRFHKAGGCGIVYPHPSNGAGIGITGDVPAIHDAVEQAVCRVVEGKQRASSFIKVQNAL